MFCLAFVFNSLQLTRVDPLELQISFTRDLVNREAAHLRQKRYDFNTVLWKHVRKNTDDVLISSITRKLQKGSMRESMWSGLKDMDLQSFHIQVCSKERERREAESDENEPAQGMGEVHIATQCESYTGVA